MKEKNKNKIITIDCHYIKPQFACSYLIIENGKAAFIETNTRFAVPLLLNALKENGLAPEDVEYIIITHVHLDHAGGTSALAAECPNALVIASERSARHIIDPERLIKGSLAVYGEKKFNALYGQIDPVPENRVRPVKDGEKIKFGTREFTFIYTPGHARHHMCVYDSMSNGIFTGDSFGLAYPALQNGRYPFIFPSTTPSDFDAEEARKSIKKIIDTGAGRFFLTHFGEIEKIEQCASMLIEFIDNIEIIQNKAAESGLSGEALIDFCVKEMTGLFAEEIKKCGVKLTPESEEIMKTDILLNAQGTAQAAGINP